MAFENAFHEYALKNLTPLDQYTINRGKMGSDGFRNTVPDAFSNTIVFGKNWIIPKGTAYEVKAMGGKDGKTVILYTSSNTNQMAGHLNSFALSHESLVKQSGYIFFNVVTTSDVLISPKLVRDAGLLKVKLIQQVAYYKKTASCSILITFWMRNPRLKTSLVDFPGSPYKPVILNTK